MNLQLVKKFADACFIAKKITECMPELPPKMKPRHFHVMDVVHILKDKSEQIKVSDISEYLNVTMPSITKLINELEELKIIKKQTTVVDKRIVTLSLTELGEEYHRIYVEEYYKEIIKLYSDIDEKDMEITIGTIEKVYDLLKISPIEITK